MWRFVLGSFLVLHGLAHSVFPMRGAGQLESTPFGRWVMTVAWIVALLGFVASGFGVMGAPPFRRGWRPMALAAAVSSVIALLGMARLDLFVGGLIDAGIVYAVVATEARRPVSRLFSSPSPLRRAAGVAGSVFAGAFFVYVAVAAVTRSEHQRWGSTAEERSKPLPGDWPGRNQAFEVNHAVTIAAPPSEVWPWLVQMGQDRAGFYSYDWLENLFGLQLRNAEALHPEWQDLKQGGFIRAAPPTYLGGAMNGRLGWNVPLLVPNRVMVLETWGAFVLEPTPEGHTRFLIRSKMADPEAPVWGSVLSFTLFDVPHFLMERKMMLGIKERAERPHPREAPSQVPVPSGRTASR